MLTKKHFKQLAKIHGDALKEMNEGNSKSAYSIFEFGLRDFYRSINTNFNDEKFELATLKLSKFKPVVTVGFVDEEKMDIFETIDHLERRQLLDAQMNDY